ncbi:MAG: NAD(P)H-hydrate dehydratase [Candidatus Nealsonbacteria bacterium CG02_land_8_20_14_3_00_34_20]|uniref:ADP-dependent (S)-NAD(P)H-hydrate dehydratase n=1 Tax=Candidatus Nealsonbacteria bacterium CG02_land_8_20_14_3_00_34_20 TaxID=1974698 RepID=A0A2M7DB74_9BACT|nr:MAG: NAD(P)H-hydrate dehydratase [Candidatus Nealsonbacteria bacterium CG02_land_8_20_14_3_00_34_20]
MIKVTKDILKDVYKPRPAEAHKYDYGLLLVIGGSEFYSGSPALNALAAFRAGVDMVQIIAPWRAANIIAAFSPNLAAYPLTGSWLTKKDVPLLVSMLKSAQAVARGRAAVVIGGGLGRSEETQEAVLEFLAQVSLPIVIDADAIYAASRNPKIFKGKNFLFTPHSYEFFVLTGKNVLSREEEKIKQVQKEASLLQTTILLKGKTDIISDGKEVALNTTGSPYLTVGGTGDTLAGICGALMARGISPFIAAQAGAFINGKAGETAALSKTEGTLATDLIEAIPEVIK